jgi:hypothetical protein
VISEIKMNLMRIVVIINDYNKGQRRKEYY